MSTVVLDTIIGKSTATTITIGSTPVVSASANSMTIRGEGSAQTSIQQGLVKSWITFGDTASAGNPAITDSFNISGITDNGAGDTTYAFSNNMAVAKGYTVSGSFAFEDDITIYVYSVQPKQDDSVATSSLRTVTLFVNVNQMGIADYNYVSTTMNGDLA